MVCSVQAYGGGLSFAQIGAAYLVAVSIATFAPTPGGLGALESALIAGLTGFGLSSGEAVSSVLTFRLLTFWLPVLPAGSPSAGCSATKRSETPARGPTMSRDHAEFRMFG